MNSFLPSDELLSAYLDGEATAQEREAVERALRESAAARQSLEELRRLQTEVRGLPRLRLDADFCAQVLRQAERAMLLGEAHAALPERVAATDPTLTEAVTSKEAVARSFLAQLPERRRPTGRLGGRTLHRVAAALAVLAPALLLIVLAGRDPQPGGTRLSSTHGSEATEFETTGSETTADYGTANRANDWVKRDLKRETREDAAGQRLETADGREGRSRQDMPAPEGDASHLDRTSGGRSLGQLADKQRGGNTLAGEHDEPGKMGETSGDPRLGKAGLAPDSATLQKASGASAANGDPSTGPAPVSGVPLVLSDLQKSERGTAVGRAGGLPEALAEDGVLVVRLWVTEDAWQSGAVGQWLAAYSSPTVGGTMRNGALAEESLFMRQADGDKPLQGLQAFDEHNFFEQKSAEKGGQEKKGDDKQADGKRADPNGDRENKSREKVSMVHVEGPADDVRALLADLNDRAKARRSVVSLAIVPPRQAENYQTWSALNYAAGIEQGTLSAAELDQLSLARRNEAGAAGSLKGGGFGGGGPEPFRKMFRETQPVEAQTPAHGDKSNPDGKPTAEGPPTEKVKRIAEREEDKKQLDKNHLDRLPKDGAAGGTVGDDVRVKDDVRAKKDDVRAKNAPIGRTLPPAPGPLAPGEAAPGSRYEHPQGKSAANRGGGAGGGPSGGAAIGSGGAGAPGGAGPPGKGPSPHPDSNKAGAKGVTNPEVSRPSVDRHTRSIEGAMKAPAETESFRVAPRGVPGGPRFGVESSSNGSQPASAADRAKHGDQPAAVAGQREAGAPVLRDAATPVRRVHAIFIVQVAPMPAAAAAPAKTGPSGTNAPAARQEKK